MNLGDGLWAKQATIGMAAKQKQFPLDVLFDIFSRLPIKTLLRFRCVSPLWCTIINDPDLASTHRLRRVEEPKILLLEATHKPLDPVFREDRSGLLMFVNGKAAYSLEGCCNGLLCFTRPFWYYNHSPLFLVNPQRQQVVELQRLPCKGAPWPPVHDTVCSCSYGLGFDCSTNTYKIVGVFFNGKNTGDDDDDDLCALVYTLGRGRSSWRAVKGPSKTTIRNRKCIHGRPVYARGALHWLVMHIHNNGVHLQYKIVYFDVGKEEFGLIYPPRFQSKSCHLVDLGGDLAMVVVGGSYYYKEIEICVMKEYDQKKEWVKEYTICLADLQEMHQEIRGDNFKVIGLFEDSEILVKVTNENFLFYNTKTGLLKYKCQYIPRLDYDTEILCHMGTLLSIALFREEQYIYGSSLCLFLFGVVFPIVKFGQLAPI